MNNELFLKFYGSCGHVILTEISKEEFEKWSEKNIVTEIDKQKIVHVYPDRYSICIDCMNIIINDDNKILRRK